jgi:ElaB/YqjD/DUF883 family membrane-anchored ribosome-binding protein
MRATKARKILHKRPHLSPNGKSLIAKVNRASSHLTKDVDQYITKKPYKTMGIIMLAGVCIGFLIRH